MAKRKTNEEFVSEIREKFKDEYIFLEKYSNAKTPILCKHDCGYTWKVAPTNILSRKGCPKCKGKLHYTLDDAKKFFNDKGLTLLATDYKDANTSMPFICTKHPQRGVQHRTLSAIINTKTPGCKYCGYEASKEKQLSNTSYDEVYQCFKNHGLELLDDKYIGIHNWYTCRCLSNPDHGIIKKRYVDVKHLNQGCPHCGHDNLRKIRRKDIDYYKNIIESKGYNFVDIEYNHRDNGGAKIYYTCPKHLQFGVQVKHVSKIKSQGCPHCAESQGELLIRKFLEFHNIQFIAQVRFNNLRGLGGNPLSYDFYLPDYNLLIEFQGIQHEKPIDIFGGESQLEIQREHDKRKKEYAKNNQYDFLEIWYSDLNDIESILENYLSLNKAVV